MGKVLVIGAGGVATVAIHKLAMNPDVFTDVMMQAAQSQSATPLLTLSRIASFKLRRLMPMTRRL